MREIFTDKKFIESKVLWLAKILSVIALFFFFLPLIILPFFNHPFADDYFCGYNLNNKGFFDYQLFIYKQWGGRFAATFIGSLFAYHGFLYTHYYLHSLLLLILNFTSILFLVNVFQKYILKTRSKFSKRVFLALLFLALEISCLPEASTFIFWFSSAITYQLPVILIQFELGVLILFLNAGNKILHNICAFILPLFVFITIGFNELFIIVQLLIFVILFYFRWHKKFSVILKLMFVIAFAASSLLVLLAPGNAVRMHEIVPKRIITGIAAITYHSAETLWNIFKTSYVWVAIIIVFLYGNHIQQNWRNNHYIKKISQRRWLIPIVILFFLIASVELPVAALKGGIIPDRYLNAVTCFVLLLLLLYFFIAGIISTPKILLFPSPVKKMIIYFSIIVTLLANTYIVDTYKSIIIAPAYNFILSEREAALKQAMHTHTIPVIKDYDAALAELLKTRYSSGTVTFQQLTQQKPPLLFFEDDLATTSSINVLKNYYRLDSIAIEKP